MTLELSCCKFPPATELSQFWDDNRNSLLQFLGEAHRGVKGFVKDQSARPIEGASMKVRISQCAPRILNRIAKLFNQPFTRLKCMA